MGQRWWEQNPPSRSWSPELRSSTMWVLYSEEPEQRTDPCEQAAVPWSPSRQWRPMQGSLPFCVPQGNGEATSPLSIAEERLQGCGFPEMRETWTVSDPNQMIDLELRAPISVLAHCRLLKESSQVLKPIQPNANLYTRIPRTIRHEPTILPVLPR